MKRVNLIPLAVLYVTILTALACGNATEPADVTGTWSYHTTNLNSPVPCNFSLVTLTLTQSGNAFTGSASGSHCTGTFENEMILNGSIFGDSVSFDIQLPNTGATSFLEIQNSGTISGDSMSGDVTVLMVVCGIVCCCDERTLSGNWSARRMM